jgi:hypothetical protein
VNEPLAISLLENIVDRERELLATAAGTDKVRQLQDLAWEQVGARVYLPQWRRLAEQHARQLAGVTPASLIEHAKHPEPLGRRFMPEDRLDVSDQFLVGYAQHVVGAAMAVWLVDRGATMQCDLGTPISFQAAETSIEPFGVLTRLADGSIATEDWMRQVTTLGLADVDLGQVATTTPAC